MIYKLPSNSEIILREIISADNPSDMLANKFKNCSVKEDRELRAILRQLSEQGYIKIFWADNVPWTVTISNSAYSYDEQLDYYESQTRQQHNISIGNNNVIKNSNIGSGNNDNDTSHKKRFYEKHPILCGVLISIVAGLILMFKFWELPIRFIEGMF